MESPKSFISKILEVAIMLAVSSYLIRLAMGWLAEVWPALLAVAIITSLFIIIWRIWKHMRDVGKW